MRGSGDRQDRGKTGITYNLAHRIQGDEVINLQSRSKHPALSIIVVDHHLYDLIRSLVYKITR